MNRLFLLRRHLRVLLACAPQRVLVLFLRPLLRSHREQQQERPFAVLDVVEQSDFHFSSSLPIFLMTGLNRLASASTT